MTGGLWVKSPSACPFGAKDRKRFFIVGSGVKENWDYLRHDSSLASNSTYGHTYTKQSPQKEVFHHLPKKPIYFQHAREREQRMPPALCGNNYFERYIM